MAWPRMFLRLTRDRRWMRVIWIKLLVTRTPAFIMLYSCVTKPVSLLNIHQKNKVLRNHLKLIFDTLARYSCVKAEYYHFEKIWRQRKTSFFILNGKFLSDKQLYIEFNFTEWYKSKILTWTFLVLPGTKTSIWCYHWSQSYERIVNGCSLLGRCSSMG